MGIKSTRWHKLTFLTWTKQKGRILKNLEPNLMKKVSLKGHILRNCRSSRFQDKFDYRELVCINRNPYNHIILPIPIKISSFLCFVQNILSHTKPHQQPLSLLPKQSASHTIMLCRYYTRYALLVLHKKTDIIIMACLRHFLQQS